jgi:hypothetical protein
MEIKYETCNIRDQVDYRGPSHSTLILSSLKDQ